MVNTVLRLSGDELVEKVGRGFGPYLVQMVKKFRIDILNFGTNRTAGQILESGNVEFVTFLTQL